MPSSEQPLELQKKAPGREEQRFGVPDRGRKLEARVEARRRRIEAAHVGQCTEGAVQRVDERLPAAPGESLARQLEQVFYRAHADRAEENEAFFRKAGFPQRHVFELFHARAGKPEGPERRRGDGGRSFEAERFQALAYPREQCVAAAEEPQAGLDLGEERLRRL